MIVDYEYKNGKLLISHINKKGNLEFKNYNMQNSLQWQITGENDPQKSHTYTSWDKKPVKKVATRYPNRYTIYEFLRNIPQQEQDDIFEFNDPNIFFCDIEVEITKGFPEAHLADNKITSVAIINKSTILLLGLKPLSTDEIDLMTKETNEYFKDFATNYKIKYHFCETEYELVDIFFNELVPKMPILTGWNFIKYDWVYLVTRARKLGINPDVASPSGKLEKPWSKNDSKEYKPIYEELPMHRLVFDYMDIFKKWDNSIKIREALSLDFISGQVLKVKKLQYDGSLKDLYHNDWYKYCLYNCIDTALVQLIHEKQKTFDIMLSISTLAKIDIKQALSTVRVTEGVLFDKFLDNGIVMVKQTQSYSNIDEDEGDTELTEESGYGGGYVKYPCVGLRNWVAIFDYASLYPNTMIQFNIAPESFKGMKINDEYALLNGTKFKIEDNDIILKNGAVFKNENSQTKQVLSTIFKDRKWNKNVSLDYYKQHKLIKDYLLTRTK